jgi:hypothetical protein
MKLPGRPGYIPNHPSPLPVGPTDQIPPTRLPTGTLYIISVPILRLSATFSTTLSTPSTPMLSSSDIHRSPFHVATDLPASPTLLPLYTPDDDPKPSSDYLAAGTALGFTPVMPTNQKRPQTQPVQDVFDLSDESTSSEESITMSSPGSDLCSPPLDLIRCSRCHNSSNRGAIDLASGSMVSYGTNLYYCRRCAKVVGYPSGR